MTSKESKSKKSVLKKVLIGGAIFFVLILTTLIIIPIFFKDELKELALKEANKMLKADVAVGDFDLTIISTFPKMKFAFHDVSITGRDEFEGIKLIDLKSLEAKLDFWSVINMEDIGVRSIKLIDPNVHVKVLKTGEANYDIVKTNEELAAENVDTTSSSFKLSLNYYEIKNGNIIYDVQDSISPMYAKIDQLNHSGSGDLTAEVFNFKTKTSADKLLYRASGSMYAELTNFKNKADVNVSPEMMDFETETNMDALTYKMDGLTYLSQVKTDLTADLVMELKEKSSKFVLKDNNLQLNALNLSFDGFYEMFENASDIDFTLASENISFKELLSLIPAFYHTGYEDMVADGSMSLKGFVKGRLDETNYPAWDFSTQIKNASIAYPDLPENINNVNIDANSQFAGGTDLDKMTVNVEKFTADFAGNKIDADFFMRNPLSDPFMKSKLDVDVDLATLEKVYPTTEKYSGKLISDLSVEGRMSSLDKGDYQNFNAAGTLKINDLNYSSEDLPAPLAIQKLLFEFSPQQLKLAEMQASMGKSDFSMQGNIRNYMGYLFKENESLKGDFTFNSKVLNLDELMPASEEGTSVEETQNTATTPNTAETEPILVPENIDFVLNTSIDKVIYDGMEINQLKGNVVLRNQEANLQQLSMQTMGGNVGLSGKYNTQNRSVPKLAFNYSLKNLDISQLSENFVTIEKLAPIAKYVNGKISSDFSMTSDLKPSFEPIFNTLTGNGSLFSNSVTVSGFKPLEKLGEVLQIDKLKQQTINNVTAFFEFKDGKVNVKPFQVKMGKINATIGGSSSFEREIDYEMKMMIPKEEIPNEIIGVAENAIAGVKNLTGFKMGELPAEIPVTALLTNTIDNPKVSTDIKERLMEAGGNIKENVKELVQDKVEEAKDSVKVIIQDKVEDVKDKAREEIEKQKQTILSAAEKQAENIRSEAKKLADKTRDEANKAAQKLVDEAGSNILKKRAAEVAADKLRKEGEKSAQKIEEEANTRANKVMQEARERADKL